jgi:hypothetical protein
MRFPILIVASLALAAGCVRMPNLEPAPGTSRVTGRGEGALAAQAGVQVVARVDAWRGEPVNLEETVTPILVTLINQSPHPLQLQYGDFKLVSSDGVQMSAIPPFDIRGSTIEPVTSFSYPMVGFRVAPYLSRYYPWMAPYPGAFIFDPVYYDTYFPQFVSIHLPTRDMVRSALPEGVLDPQGRAEGFVYFQTLPRHIRSAEFRMTLVDATTRESFGTVSIPFINEAVSRR